MTPVTPIAEGVRLRIRLTPKAARAGFGPLERNAAGEVFLKARVTTAPEDGKANKSLVKMLARALKLPAGDISVASGATSRNKQILIKGDGPEHVARITNWIRDISP